MLTGREHFLLSLLRVALQIKNEHQMLPGRLPCHVGVFRNNCDKEILIYLRSGYLYFVVYDIVSSMLHSKINCSNLIDLFRKSVLLFHGLAI